MEHGTKMRGWGAKGLVVKSSDFYLFPVSPNNVSSMVVDRVTRGTTVEMERERMDFTDISKG